MAEKPFLPIGCNSSEFGTDDPQFVSIGGGELLNQRDCRESGCRTEREREGSWSCKCMASELAAA